MINTARNVGVIGLGHLGLPIALRLLSANLRVGGNRRHDAPAEFLQAGGHAYPSPAQLADDCPVVITVLPAADALMAVVNGHDGLAGTRRSGGIWVEMSTVPASVKRELAATLATRGWRTLDCPVSGAPDQVRAGQAVLLSSGDYEVHRRLETMLHAISPRVSYLGHFGNGMFAKYTAYLLLAGHSLVAAEALAFAHRTGLNQREVLSALHGTIVSSAVFDQRAQQVVNPSGEPASGVLSGLIETLDQLNQLAVQLAAPTPVLHDVLTLLDRGDTVRTDELVVALYQQLTPEPTGSPEQEQR